MTTAPTTTTSSHVVENQPTVAELTSYPTHHLDELGLKTRPDRTVEIHRTHTDS